jgi:aminotransferase/cystathionine beta-lyase
MKFDFDTPIDRHNTDSIKWNKYSKEILPLWIADMDFKVAPCIQEALNQRINLGTFGYTQAPQDFKEQIAQYLFEQYQWQVDPEWVVVLPSVISGLHTASRQFMQAGQSCLVPKPVYQHLRLAVTQAQQELIEIPMVLSHNRWVLPWLELNQYVKKNTKLMHLCNPQNPGGTVFTLKELTTLAEFVIENNLFICSDEIHAGLVLDKTAKHIPIASLNADISQRTVTLMSLNKTFNFPGMGLAWAVVENHQMRKAMQTDLHATIAEPSLLGYVCTQAAMQYGEPWRLELIEYLCENLKTIEAFIRKNDQISQSNVQATYLSWLDLRKLQFNDVEGLLLKNGLALSPGSQFGSSEFMRLNFGTSAKSLNEGLNRLERVLKSRK